MDVIYKWVVLLAIIHGNMIIHGLLFRRIIHRELGDHKMSAETINLVLNGLLKPEHDKKRYQHCGQPNADAYYSYLVNSGSETLLLFETDSFRYEI